MRLDEQDEVLLLALERDARASVVALARQIGLSRSATQERLARLERSGAIAGYTIRRGPAESAGRLHAWLAIRHAEGGSCARILPQLERTPEVVGVHALAGDLDMLVEVSAAGAGDLDRIAAAVRGLPGVAEVVTHVVLATPIARRTGA